MGRQKVWRSSTEHLGYGYYIWDIIECEGVTEKDLNRFPGMYLPTLDGGYILSPQCFHTWDSNYAFYLFWKHDKSFFELIPLDDGPVPF